MKPKGASPLRVKSMKIIDTPLLDQLTLQARSNPRLRQHFNLHRSYDEPSQRLLNALEPETYIRPHRHLRDPKPENFIGLSGRMVLLTFSEEGTIEQVLPFGPGEGILGIDLPPGIWHTVICLESGSVLLEAKPGPFLPIYDKDLAPWAPEEGSAEAVGYLEDLRTVVLTGA